MKQSLFVSPPPGRTRASFIPVLVGGLLLVPAAAWAKAPKSAPSKKAEATDSETRSKELLKKHFPLEEDIGPLPVVRVPKHEEGKVPAAAARVEKPRPEKPKTEAKGVPHPVAARPADSVMAAPSPPIDPVPAAPPKPKEPEQPEHGPGPSLGSEDNRQIDDLLSRALTDGPAPSEPQQKVDPVLPPLGMVAIKQTMQALQPEVERDCRLGRLGVVQVRVVVAPSGEVARVTPQGKLAKGPPAPCVAERVRRARFPRSAGGTFEYTLTVR